MKKVHPVIFNFAFFIFALTRYAFPCAENDTRRDGQALFLPAGARFGRTDLQLWDSGRGSGSRSEDATDSAPHPVSHPAAFSFARWRLAANSTNRLCKDEKDG